MPLASTVALTASTSHTRGHCGHVRRFVCCWFIESVFSGVFPFNQTRIIFKEAPEGIVALTASSCLILVHYRHARRSFVAGSSNTIQLFYLSSLKTRFTPNVPLTVLSYLRPRFAYILLHCGHAQSQGGRQPAAAKYHLYQQHGILSTTVIKYCCTGTRNKREENVVTITAVAERGHPHDSRH